MNIKIRDRNMSVGVNGRSVNRTLLVLKSAFAFYRQSLGDHRF